MGNINHSDTANLTVGTTGRKSHPGVCAGHIKPPPSPSLAMDRPVTLGTGAGGAASARRFNAVVTSVLITTGLSVPQNKMLREIIVHSNPTQCCRFKPKLLPASVGAGFSFVSWSHKACSWNGFEEADEP